MVQRALWQGCSSWGAAKKWVTILRCQSQGQTPGAAPEQESFLGTRSLSHVLFALGCPARLADGSVMTAQLYLNCPSGQAGPVLPKQGECWGDEQKRTGRKGIDSGNLLLGFTWMGHVSVRKGHKARKNKWSCALLSFCATERSNLQILQALPVGENLAVWKGFLLLPWLERISVRSD